MPAFWLCPRLHFPFRTTSTRQWQDPENWFHIGTILATLAWRPGESDGSCLLVEHAWVNLAGIPAGVRE